METKRLGDKQWRIIRFVKENPGATGYAINKNTSAPHSSIRRLQLKEILRNIRKEGKNFWYLTTEAKQWLARRDKPEEEYLWDF